MGTAKKIFVVRAKPHHHDREDQFLAGTISIGWPIEESLKGKDWHEIRKLLKPTYPEIKKMSVTQVHNFVNMPIGSIILTPSYKNRDIHIFETISDYSYKSEWADDDIGNLTVALMLTSKMKGTYIYVRMTMWPIAALKDHLCYNRGLTFVNINDLVIKGIENLPLIK